MNSSNDLPGKVTIFGVSPFHYIRGQPRYRADDLLRPVSNLIASKTGSFFTARAKTMKDDLEVASGLLINATDTFKCRLDAYSATCKDIDSVTNKASQQLRITTEKLSQGLSRIEKTANFANLERYTILLERSAQALSILADLETKGQLGKISAALK